MSKSAFITVKCGTEELHIQSDFNAQITLPNAALGRLIDFEQLKINVNSHVLVKYWVGCYKIFNKKILKMFKAFGTFHPLLKVELEKLPYVQLFIMSIIKSDDIMFGRLYPFITTCDLEICYYISQSQFTNSEIHKGTQSILTLFRYIRINTKQNAMLNAILKKMSLYHIVYQIYMLECDKYNIAMYNIAAAYVTGQQMAMSEQSLVNSYQWPCMLFIKNEQPSALYETGPNWPHAGLDGHQYVTCEFKTNEVQKPEIQNPIWQIKYKPLTGHQTREMQACPKLNPSLSKQLIKKDEPELPRAKKDYSEFLGLTMARPIEFSWPI